MSLARNSRIKERTSGRDSCRGGVAPSVMLEKLFSSLDYVLELPSETKSHSESHLVYPSQRADAERRLLRVLIAFHVVRTSCGAVTTHNAAWDLGAVSNMTSTQSPAEHESTSTRRVEQRHLHAV